MPKGLDKVAGIIGKEVGEALSKGIPAAKKVVEKAAKAVDDKVDDWGWKGGKKGEITGTDLEKATKQYNKHPEKYRETFDLANEQLSKSLSKKPDSPIAKTFGTSLADERGKYSAHDVMDEFYQLEKADIPRAWTGKVLNAIVKKHGRATYKATPAEAKIISNSMRPLTNAQRDTFIKLYPEWEGSLEDLAKAAKNL